MIAVAVCSFDSLASDKESLRELKREAEIILDELPIFYSFHDKYQAQVWFQDMSNRMKRYIKNPTERKAILRSVHKHASANKIRPEIILALIEVESNFDRFAISIVGARGLMQVMPFWKTEIGKASDNLFEIDTNIEYGTSILRIYMDKEKGDIVKALARYNGSIGKWHYTKKIFEVLDKTWY